jgi:hypothetical protein
MSRAVTRRIILTAFFVVGSAFLLGLWAPSSSAEDTGPIDGVWEGTLDWVHGPGLQKREYPSQVWRMVLEGDNAKMFIVRNGKLQEVHPGKWKVERLGSNVLIHGITSGTDSDGQWIETSSFILLKRDPNTLGVVHAGAVNNVGLPLTSDISKFFSVQTGNFHRAQ